MTMTKTREDAQSTTENYKYDEVTDSELFTVAIEEKKITQDAFKTYVAAKMEHHIYEAMTNEELKSVYLNAIKEANTTLGTSYKPMRISDMTKRLKRCKHCDQLFIDLSLRNQTPTCSRLIAFDSNNNIMHRNNQILTECLREYQAKQRRTTDDNRSVAEYREVDISVFTAVMDENGNIVDRGKRRPQDEAVSLPVFDSIRGVFDEYWNVKDQQKYDALDDYTKQAVTPSAVTVYTIDEYNERNKGAE